MYALEYVLQSRCSYIEMLVINRKFKFNLVSNILGGAPVSTPSKKKLLEPLTRMLCLSFMTQHLCPAAVGLYFLLNANVIHGPSHQGHPRTTAPHSGFLVSQFTSDYC